MRGLQWISLRCDGISEPSYKECLMGTMSCATDTFQVERFQGSIKTGAARMCAHLNRFRVCAISGDVNSNPRDSTCVPKLVAGT